LGSVVPENKKAQNRFELQVDSDLPIDYFLEINGLTFKREGKRLPYQHEIMYRIGKGFRKDSQLRCCGDYSWKDS